MAKSGSTPGSGATRLANVQVLRGVAVLLVLSAHSIDASELVAGRWGIASAGYVENFGAFGVDLFFVISGFVMAFSVASSNGHRAAGDFLVRRWIRIAPPYLIASAIGVVVLASTYRLVPTVRSYLNTLLFVPIFDRAQYSTPLLPVGWTLSFEFTFYLLVAALLAVRLAHRPGVLVCAIGVLVVAGHLFPGGGFLLGWLTNPMLLEFATGIVIYIASREGFVARFWLPACGLGLLGGGVLIWQILFGFGSISEQQFITDGALSLRRAVFWGLPAGGLFLGAIALRPVGNSVPGRAFLAIGDASYSIYLIHLPAIAVFATAMPVLWPTIPGALVVLLGMSVGLGAGIVFFHAVERPLGALLSGAYGTAALARRLKSSRRVAVGAGTPTV